MNHSSTLGFSPQLPVSVYGTGRHTLFLEVSSQDYPRSRSLVVLSPKLQRAIRQHAPTPTPRRMMYDRYGNINPFSIDFPFRVRLRSRLTLF